MNQKVKYLLLIFLSFKLSIFAQELQKVRGRVTDLDSQYPIEVAIISTTIKGQKFSASTDKNGYFKIENLPIGYIDLKIVSTGYKTIFKNNLLLISGKELITNIQMEEEVNRLDEVVIFGKLKSKINNENGSVSIKSFDAEQASKYAGSLNDPARMVANFAGVQSSNDSRNDIVVRGNSPLGVLWRLEDVDVFNPNHFGTFGSTGGPVSMLNNNLLANSDFLSGAFPADYGNVTSAVFDLKMRKGNNETHEFLGQVGFNGFEIGAEGPFSNKQNGPSYIINYRLSTLEFFKAAGLNLAAGSAIPKYQDISFKTFFPTKNAGEISLFGLGGTSNIDLVGSDADLNDLNSFSNETEDIYNKNKLGMVGLSYKYYSNNRNHLKMTLAYSQQEAIIDIDSVDWGATGVKVNDITRYFKGSFKQKKSTAHLKHNSKINNKNKLTSGVITDFYNFNFSDSTLVNPTVNKWAVANDINGNGFLLRQYVNWQHKFNNKLSTNIGFHQLYFDISKSYAFEPRLGIVYEINKKDIISGGFGVHNQIQTLPIYFKQNIDNGELTNKKLDFTKSIQYVINWKHQFKKNISFKTEIYYQNLTNVPVENVPSSFSLINIGADFDIPDNTDLINNGLAYNYGIELTLEKQYREQYYFLFTTSLFDSKYKGSDGILRNTTFNNNYVMNFLAGKEFNIDPNKSKQFSIDWKLTYAGGNFYSPIDENASLQAGREITDDKEAYSERFKNYFRTDIKFFFRLNRSKLTHEFGVEIQNLTNRENIFAKKYNERTNSINDQLQLGLLVVPQYRILF